MDTPQRLLDVDGLTVMAGKGPERVALVTGVSFSLDRGEILGIVGESGSGKTVTALGIARLLPQDQLSCTADELRIYPTDKPEGVDILSVPAARMHEIRGRRIAMVFQEPMTSLNPVMRSGRQVEEAVLQHITSDPTEARRLTLSWLEKVKLDNPERIYEAYPHQLSGGQKQRVMIAMALACNPELLIADEPTTSLDADIQEAITTLIYDLCKEMNVAAIFISHDLAQVEHICDKLLIMHKGRVIEQGTAAEIFLRPQEAYTRALMACRPPADRYLRRLPVIEDFMAAQGAEVPLPATVIERLTLTADEKLTREQLLEGQPNILEVREVSASYATQQNFWGRATRTLEVLNQFSLTIRKGETLGIQGPSGCGKSTLARIIMCLQAPDAGSVVFNGKNLQTLSDKQLRRERRHIQMVFQDPLSALNPRMTVQQILSEPLLVHKLYPTARERQDYIDHLLTLTGLDPNIYKKRLPRELSGGQCQRLGIARALSVSPQLIIFDEAVSSLDVSVQAQILNLLCDLRERLGLTYLFISHDADVVRHFSDRVVSFGLRPR